jgi:hypothetical protein
VDEEKELIGRSREEVEEELKRVEWAYYNRPPQMRYKWEYRAMIYALEWVLGKREISVLEYSVKRCSNCNSYMWIEAKYCEKCGAQASTQTSSEPKKKEEAKPI